MRRKGPALTVLAVVLAVAGGCRQDMHDQPRYEPLEASAFFDDGRSARPLVDGTVARGDARLDEAMYTGKRDGKDVDAFPFPVTEQVMRRGRERFDVFCSPCHGLNGEGDGLVVRRGYRRPPSFASETLRKAPVGHFFDVMTNGWGAMPDYASQVAPRDRWAIAAYIRALQAARTGDVRDVPVSEQDRLRQSAGR